MPTASRRGYSDQPTSADALGMEKKYDGLARFIGECETPMTIAINGDWGSGKSSAMRIIQEKLRQRLGEAVQDQIIEFNTWEFSIVSDNSKLVLELLRALDEKLTEIEEKHRITPPDKNAGRLLTALSVAGGALRDLTVSIINESEAKHLFNVFKGAQERRNKADGDAESFVYTSPTRLLRTVSQSISRRITAVVDCLRQEGQTDPRIFIFIDDLDRLDPRVALELIEGMKNFADYQNCVFVLAVDQKVVERGLRSKYGNEFSDEMAQHFFDKIIQLPFVLPVNAYRLNDYVAHLLQNSAMAQSGQADAELAKKYAAMLRKFGIRNPRTIKRSFNMLHMYQCMNESGRQEAPEAGAAGYYRQYAVLLLLLTSAEDHARMAQLVDSGCAYESGEELLQIEREFRALRTRGDDEDDEGCSEYIAAVLDAFYEKDEAAGEAGGDPIATKALIDALAFTRSEEVDRANYASARFIFELVRRLEAGAENAVLRRSPQWMQIRRQASTVYELAQSQELLRVTLDPLAGGSRLMLTRNPNSGSGSKKCFLSLYSEALSQELLEEVGGFQILEGNETPEDAQNGSLACYWNAKENERSRVTIFLTESNARNAGRIFELMARCGCFGGQGAG